MVALSPVPRAKMRVTFLQPVLLTTSFVPLLALPLLVLVLAMVEMLALVLDVIDVTGRDETVDVVATGTMLVNLVLSIGFHESALK
jgi:hypothetical protein